MSEPIRTDDISRTFIERHILGDKYIDFNKEPLVKVADGKNMEYLKVMEKVGKGEQVVDDHFFLELAEKRKELCEARLQASNSSNDKRLRDERLKWEAELWYTEIALSQRENAGGDRKVLKAVARSIAGEMIEKNREYYLKKQSSPLISTIGEEKFEKRTLELAKLYG
jgi:hypothetical protein